MPYCTQPRPTTWRADLRTYGGVLDSPSCYLRQYLGQTTGPHRGRVGRLSALFDARGAQEPVGSTAYPHTEIDYCR